MWTFLILLLIGVMAFADAFESIERSLMLEAGDLDTEGTSAKLQKNTFESYLGDYAQAWHNSFLTALGEFSDDLEKYTDGQWLVFILSAIFNIVLLLNLLIAIISETYERVSRTRIPTAYKEKAQNIG